MAERITYLIVGNGIAGVTAAEVLRSEDSSASIGVIADDPFPVYYRPALKDYLAGRVREDRLWARPTSFYQDHNILFLPDRVTKIQAGQRYVQLQSNQQIGYEKLLLASGASPARLSCPGTNLRGVWTLRTVADYQGVLERLSMVRRVVVSGSGTLALETIETLRHRGFAVTHLIRRNTLWSEVLDATASDLVLQQERRGGVDVRLEEEISEITGARGEVTGVVTNQGKRIACEMVLIAIGVEPNIDFIRASGIPCRRGVRVDPGMRTMAPDIYAAGDVLETTDPLTGRTRVIGQWYPAVQQGRAAAYNMLDLLDTDQPFNAGTFYNATFLYGLDFACVGLTNQGARDGYQELVADPQARTYRKVLLKDGIPVGALALGDRKQIMALKRAIDHRVSLASISRRLFAPDFNLANWLDEQGISPARLGVQRSGEVAVRQVVSQSMAGLDVPGVSEAKSINNNNSNESTAKIRKADKKAQAREPVNGEDRMERGKAGISSSADRQEALLVQVLEAGQRLRFPEALLSQTSVFTIGRQAGVHLLIDEGSVSRRHAEISYAGGLYVLRDLGSTNGTFVNETRLDSARPYVLQANDRIRFGNVAAFTFMVRTLARARRIANPASSAGLTRQYDIEPDPQRARQGQGQMVLNPDGSLQPPGASNPLPPAVVATFKDTPALIVLPEDSLNRPDVAPQVHLLRVGKRMTLGRDAGCDILLDDAVVSRRHAEIVPGPDGFYLRDLGSSNGVYVNATRLTNPYLLTHGDRVKMGDTLLFFIDLQAGREATVQAPVPQAVRANRPVPAVPEERREVGAGAQAVRATVQRKEAGSEITTKRTQAVQAQRANVVICPHCGTANTRIARFCAGCSGLLG